MNFVNSHAVFPTVTRVNATAIGTGTYPNRNGMFGNQIYVRAVEPNRAFNNDAHENLLRLDAATGGGMVLVKSLGALLAEHGKTLAVVSSGSTGSALQAARRRGRKAQAACRRRARARHVQYARAAEKGRPRLCRRAGRH